MAITIAVVTATTVMNVHDERCSHTGAHNGSHVRSIIIVIVTMATMPPS